MQIKNVLVTGGGGFLGKAIVKKLLKKNYKVTSFSRNFYPELEKMGVKQIQGDLVDKNAVMNAFNQIDAVFHVAAKFEHWGKFKDFFNINVTGTQNVIYACLENNIKQLIYTSSPSVIFNENDMENVDESVPYPKTYLAHYPETKAMAEKLVKKVGGGKLATIILRPHLIWGPEDKQFHSTFIQRSNRLKRVGKKEYLIDTIYIDNAADAHILALEKLFEKPSLSGNVYFISQDEPIPIWKHMNALLDAAGLPPMKAQISEKTVNIAGTLFEFAYKFFNIKGEPTMTKFAAKVLSTHHWFNISKAKKDLGYYPKISTEEGLKRLKLWFSTMEQKNDN